MREIVCPTCNGHRELVIPTTQVQPNGERILVYVRSTCTDCNGTGVKFVWSED
jgi:hypothetical protein